MMEDQFNKYSDAEAHRVAHLVAGYIKGTLSNKERDELDEWICASDENMKLFEKLTDEDNLNEAMRWMESVNTEEALHESKKGVRFNEQGGGRLWMKFLPYAVAASVIIIAAIVIFKPFSKRNNAGEMASTMNDDILPGASRAILTFENGKSVIVDEGRGDTSINGQIKIMRKQGEIVYNDQVTNAPMIYHTLTIPRKGHYKLVLPDGTKVWMNAASSIRYPVAFAENERKVFLTGEAYFEVSRKGKERPFRVVVNEIVVEALGTAFNINAYSNEPFFSATLMEGSVLVTNGKSENMLRPGQQAKISANGFTIDEVETNDVIAWKENLFRFTNAPLDEIMRQIERWYDTEVVYENMPRDHFNLTDVPRDVPVSKLLRALELTKRVHFKIEKNKIIVRE